MAGVCAGVCAFNPAAQITAIKAPTKNILQKCITSKSFRKTPIAASQAIVLPRTQNLPHREKFHKEIFEEFLEGKGRCETSISNNKCAPGLNLSIEKRPPASSLSPQRGEG